MPQPASGNSNNKYYGEYYIRNYIRLAKNAVVILNRLCYASGNSEPGHANPTKSVAQRRVDNFGAGFLRAGARGVFAIGTASASYTLKSVLTASTTLYGTFRYDPARNLHYDFAFNSTRTNGDAGLDGSVLAGPLLPIVRRQPECDDRLGSGRLTVRPSNRP